MIMCIREAQPQALAADVDGSVCGGEGGGGLKCGGAWRGGVNGV